MLTQTFRVRLLAAALCASAALAQDGPLTDRERMLLERIENLEQRLAALEAKLSPAGPASSGVAAVPSPLASTPATDSPSLPGFLAGTTINGYLDGYYGYNFNHPVGRVNLLRANDVLHNSFSLNQADLILERVPDAAAGRRLGMRIDLMFGQSTESMQGNPLNEPRPQAYRNIFQAYGSYLAPIGSGLQFDFGKFASGLGIENNYTKDQYNYSRSYLFNVLPFYHMGLRTAYNVSNRLSVQYWLVNGVNQAEDFNGYKSNAFLFTIKPTKTISWSVDYYFGQENRDLAPVLSPGPPALPTQPGLSIIPVPGPKLNGRTHIIDTYASWSPNDKVTVAGEFDHVLSRLVAAGPPSHVIGGAGYAQYHFAPKFSLAGRFEYLQDHGGLFSGVTQALKEGTVTATLQPAGNFQIRWEFRHDYSNQPFFLTRTPGVVQRDQNTALMGLLWWFGGKQGSW